MPKLADLVGNDNKENHNVEECYKVLEMAEIELKTSKRQIKVLQERNHELIA